MMLLCLEVKMSLFHDLPSPSQQRRQQQQQQQPKKRPATGSFAGVSDDARDGDAREGKNDDNVKKAKKGLPATAATGQSGGGGAGEDGATNGAPMEGKGDDGGTNGAQIEGKGVAFGDAVEKIGKALSSSKLDKFVKAAGLLTQLVKAELDGEGSRPTIIHDTIAAFMEQPANLEKLTSALEARQASITLFSTLQSQILLFSPVQQYRIVSWVLMGSTRVELYTDDSFQFRKACRRVKEVLGFLRGSEDDDGLLEKERRRALLLCLTDAFKMNTFAWARPSIEDTFGVASEKRFVFPPGEREELDELTTKLRTSQRGNTVNTTGTVVSRAVRLAESTSNPWTSKRTDILKR